MLTNVYKINEKDYEDFIKSNNKVVILYYKNDCLYCKALIASLRKIALNYSDSNVSFAIMDITKLRRFCLKKRMFVFPTVEVYNKHSLINTVNGNISIDELEKRINL